MKQHQRKRQQGDVLRNWPLLPVIDTHPSGALEEPQKMCLGTENSKYKGRTHLCICFCLLSLEGGPWAVSVPALAFAHAHGWWAIWLPLTFMSEKPQGRKKEVCGVHLGRENR